MWLLPSQLSSRLPCDGQKPTSGVAGRVWDLGAGVTVGGRLGVGMDLNGLKLLWNPCSWGRAEGRQGGELICRVENRRSGGCSIVGRSLTLENVAEFAGRVQRQWELASVVGEWGVAAACGWGDIEEGGGGGGGGSPVRETAAGKRKTACCPCWGWGAAARAWPCCPWRARECCCSWLRGMVGVPGGSGVPAEGTSTPAHTERKGGDFFFFFTQLRQRYSAPSSRGNKWESGCGQRERADGWVTPGCEAVGGYSMETVKQILFNINSMFAENSSTAIKETSSAGHCWCLLKVFK